MGHQIQLLFFINFVGYTFSVKPQWWGGIKPSCSVDIPPENKRGLDPPGQKKKNALAYYFSYSV